MINIPGLVLAQLDMHVAKTRLDLETIKAKLEKERVQLTRSRVLRAERHRLTEELAAWEYIHAHAAGTSIRYQVKEEFSRREGTTAAGIEPAECEICKHHHVRGKPCESVLDADSYSFCGCTS